MFIFHKIFFVVKRQKLQTKWHCRIFSVVPCLYITPLKLQALLPIVSDGT